MKKIILILLMINSSSLILAQYNKENAKNIIKEKMKATMQQNPRDQEIQQDKVKRQEQAAQNTNQEITAVQKKASWIDKNFKPEGYMNGLSDVDISSFSGIQNNSQRQERLRLLEIEDNTNNKVSTIEQKPKEKSARSSEGINSNAIPITQRDAQSSYDNNSFKDGVLKVEKRELEGDVVHEGYVQQSSSIIGSLWNKFDNFMSSTYEDGEYGERIGKEYVFFLSELRSCYQDVRDFSVDAWERYEIPYRVANTLQSIKNGAVDFVNNPLEVAQNARDRAKDNIKEYVKENAFKPVIKLVPNYSSAVENSKEAKEFISDLAKNTVDLFEEGKVVDAIGNPEKTKEWNNKYNRFQNNTLKKASAMVGNVEERNGIVKFHDVLEPVYNLSDKEESGPYSKEEVKEEAKKQVQNEVKKTVQKEAKKQVKASITKAFKKKLPKDLVKNLEFYIEK